MKAASPKFCAFCGTRITNINISKEHIWPDWLKDYVPKISSHNRHTASLGGVISQFSKDKLEFSPFAKINRGTLNRPGDPHSQTLRIVCKGCNNGWMSQVVSRAKGDLIPFIDQKWDALSPDAIDRIATWACLFTMVVEFADIHTMATTPAERRALMDKKLPPENWVVWLGHYRGTKWRGAFNHFGTDGAVVPMDTLEQVPPASALTPWFASQSTAFCLGSLFVFTYSSRGKVRIDPEKLAEATGVKRVWPATGDVIPPPTVILNDFTADQISRLCLHPSHRPFVRAVWETI